jgi:glycosyltransferase involved in cell wall biosynthesis
LAAQYQTIVRIIQEIINQSGMRKIPKISVVIPCYNAQSWIGETLNSVVVQGYGNIEIIVVDDGSTDDTSLITEREFPFVKIIKTENNGPSRARNIGTGASTGELIQYLDADDLLGEGKLELQAEALINNGAEVAYGDWQKIAKSPDGNYKKGEIMIREMVDPEIDLFTSFWCPPAVYLFRRSIVDKVGQWHEGLRAGEDARFLLDCALQGARFIYCSGIMAHYRVHTSQSVSTRDNVAFVRDCYKNATEIESWWVHHGGLTQQRLNGLLNVFGHIARSSYHSDPDTFELAYQSLERLRPGYLPVEPKHLAILSKWLGYRNAEAIALNYRKTKAVFKRLKSIFSL